MAHCLFYRCKTLSGIALLTGYLRNNVSGDLITIHLTNGTAAFGYKASQRNNIIKVLLAVQDINRIVMNDWYQLNATRSNYLTLLKNNKVIADQHCCFIVDSIGYFMLLSLFNPLKKIKRRIYLYNCKETIVSGKLNTFKVTDVNQLAQHLAKQRWLTFFLGFRGLIKNVYLPLATKTNYKHPTIITTFFNDY